jgi:hypothetical protein
MKKGIEQPHEKRQGWLKNGNPPGDFSKAPRCGAKTRAGTSCKCPAMANGRCRLHGGKSTGPRTPEGLERCKRANWKTGEHSEEARVRKRQFAELIKRYNETINDAQEVS